MRVVLLIHEFPVVSETFIVNKFRGLLSHGVDVYIVADRLNPDAWSTYRDLANDTEARHRIFGWPKSPAHRFTAACWQTAAAIARRPFAALRCMVYEIRRFGLSGFGRAVFAMPIIRRSPDLVHHEFGAGAIHRQDIGEAAGVPMTCSFRGFDLNYESAGHPERFQQLWPALSGVHVLGNDLLDRARRKGMPTSMPLAIIPPAVDPAVFAPSSRTGVAESQRRPLQILSIGRLHWKKGYEYAIEAIADLVRRNVDLEYRIVGGGEFESALRTCIEDYDLGEHVTLLGECNRAAVISELNRADVLLHAAVSEGFCNAVLEAQAMGVPVVCSDADGLRENVVDQVTGFVVPRRDASGLSDAIDRLARDAELRASFGRAGRARVEEHFDPDAQIRRFEEFFRAIVGTP